MAKKEFFDRKEELRFLQEKYAELSPSNMLVLYGRRRVGKTGKEEHEEQLLAPNDILRYLEELSRKRNYAGYIEIPEVQARA